MTEKLIVVYGHPRLRERAAPVTTFDESVCALVADLFDSMRAERGIGLAAPQIDVGLRAIVVSPRPAEGEPEQSRAMINPEILEYEGSVSLEEGCLSVPGVYAEIRRPETIRVRYWDVEGIVHEETFSGMMARVVQHETDHLEGKLFVDRLSPMRRSLLARRLRGIDTDRRRQAVRL